MTTPCGALRDRLPEYLEDSLSAGERRAFREHLAACAACRDELARVEPSILFARMPAPEVSSDDVLRVLAGVRAGIALAETEKRARRGRPSHRHRVAAMASAAALAAMTLVLPGSGRRPADLPVSAPMATIPSPGFAPASERQPGGTYPADATIYDWNPGAAPAEPRVVWIVDRSLDI